MDGGDVQHGFAHVGPFLIVFAEATIATEPGEAPLHHPAPREEQEAALLGWALDDGDLPLEQVVCVLDQLAAIRLVGPDQQE